MVEAEKFSWRRCWPFALFLIVATLIAYGPALTAGFVWDDAMYVTENPLLAAPDGLRRIWFTLESTVQYFPLTHTSFYLERSLWGLNPAGYHLVNILLHAANALLLWQVLNCLRVPGAWLAAAIFALHPVQVESVAWITERKNVLMGVFFLLTLLAWIKFIDERCRSPWRFYVLALVCYMLALLAKTTACTLPAALLLILWLKKMPIDGRRLAQVAPFLILGFVTGLVAVAWEHQHRGVQPRLLIIGVGERVLIASRALWFYAGKLFWPANLTVSYPRWTISATDPLAYIWIAATALLAMVIWWVRRWTGRSVEVGVIFFAATLSPMLGFVMHYFYAYSFVADHFQYLACIGLMALAAAGIEVGLGRMAAGKWVGQRVLAPALLITLGILTWKQCKMYADDDTLWQTTLRQNPNSLVAHASIGTSAFEQGQMDEAITHYEKALAIDPNFTDLHYDLGLAYSKLGRMDEAIAQYKKEVEIHPNHAMAHNNLGMALIRKGDLDEAIAHLQTAARIAPSLGGVQNSLGVAFAKKGLLKEAIVHFQKSMESVPPEVEACNNLAWLLATAPDSSLRNGTRALALAQQASQLAGKEDPLILQSMAAAQAEIGNYPEALTAARRALELAVMQKNSPLAGCLQMEIKLYEAGAPARDDTSRWNQ